MTRFRYFYDVGSGWVEINPVNNSLVWSNEVSINPAITRIILSGSCTLIGSEYDSIITYRDAGNLYVDIKVEQYNGTWNTIYEGNADIRKPWNENEKSITLNKFNNGDEYYDIIISNENTKYNYSDLTTAKHRIVTPSDTSTTIDAAKVAGTGLTPAQYILAYDVNGFTVIPTYTDPRWAYFLFRSTNPDGSHNFETMSFTYEVNENWNYTEIRLLRNNEYDGYWVKLPPAVGATETVVTTIAAVPQRLADLIDAMLQNVASGLTFTESTAITYTDAATNNFNFSNYLFDETSQISVATAKLSGSSVTFKFMVDLMRDAFNLFWYIDGTALKFIHASDLTTTGSLDLSTESIDLKQLRYGDIMGDSDIPDIEDFFTNDSEGEFTIGNPFGRVEIFYRGGINSLSNRNRKEHHIKVNTNVDYMLANKAEKGKGIYALLEATDNTSTPRVIYSTATYNTRLSPSGLFYHLNKWRYNDEADLATGLKFGWPPLADMESRPLKTVTIINYHVDLLTDYDMKKQIITAAGNGQTKKISQLLNSDVAQIEVVI